MVNTWGRGRFTPRFGNYVDLYQGPELLVDGWNKTKSKSFCVNYENLVTSPDVTIKHLLGYLEMPYDEMTVLPVGGEALKGALGDKTGVNLYHEISADSLDNWKHTINTHYRKSYARKYLKTIGKDTLSAMGYSIDDLLEELESITTVNGLGIRDAFDDLRTVIYNYLTGVTPRKVLKKILVPGCFFWTSK